MITFVNFVSVFPYLDSSLVSKLANRLVGCLYVDKYEKLHYFITFYKTSQPNVPRRESGRLT